MKFRNFAEKLLGSKTKVNVLSYLLLSEIPLSEREMSKYVGASNTAVSKILKEFHELNLISPIRIGNSLTWKLNRESYAYQSLDNSFKWLSKNKPLEHLKDTILQNFCGYSGIKRLVIFGSIAKGTEEFNSDIDLFILVDNEQSKKDVIKFAPDFSEKCLKYFGNIASIFVFTDSELEKKENQHIKSKIKGGILVI